MFKSYDTLAALYDLAHATLTDDLPFWQALAREHGGPVLEYGCGTGRVTLPLLRAGVDVTGIDDSPAMLARCHARLSARPALAARATLVEAGMLDFATDQRFALALLPYNTLMHLTSPADQLALLHRAHTHLGPGGVLAFDIGNPFSVLGAEDPGQTLIQTFSDDEGCTIQQFAHQRLDPAAQRSDVLWQFDRIAPDGQVSRTLVPLSYRLIFPGELHLMLAQTGFTLLHLLGDFDYEQPFDAASPRMVVVARRS